MKPVYYPAFENIFPDRILEFYKQHGCKKKYPIVEDKDGNWHLVPEDVKTFALERKLNPPLFREVLSGKYRHRNGVYMGYKLITPKLRHRQTKWDEL